MCGKTRAINTTTYSSPLKHFAFVVVELNIPMRRKSALCGKLMVHIITQCCSPVLARYCVIIVCLAIIGSKVLHVCSDFCHLSFGLLVFSLSSGSVPVFFSCCFLSNSSCWSDVLNSAVKYRPLLWEQKQWLTFNGKLLCNYLAISQNKSKVFVQRNCQISWVQDNWVNKQTTEEFASVFRKPRLQI